MSVFTALQSDQIEQFLNQYDVGQLLLFKAIHDGVTNSNYSLTTSQGDFILSLYEQNSFRDQQQILSAQQQLFDLGINCAEIIISKQDQLLIEFENKPASLIRKIPGNIDFPITNNLCQQIGMTLAQLHSQSHKIELNRENPRGMSWIFNTADRLIDSLAESDRHLMQQELAYLSRYSHLSLPSGFIHADLFPDNVLVKDDYIQGIIDFDYCCQEVFLFDLCIAINAWCSRPDGSLDRLKMRDMIASYSSIRSLDANENLSIPMMLRATALRFWLSRLLDELNTAESDSVLQKPSQQFRQILIARQARLSGMQR